MQRKACFCTLAAEPRADGGSERTDDRRQRTDCRGISRPCAVLCAVGGCLEPRPPRRASATGADEHAKHHSVAAGLRACSIGFETAALAPMRGRGTKDT